MDNTERVKGYITYRTFVISDEADGAAEFEEQCYEGECLVEKDEAGIPRSLKKRRGRTMPAHPDRLQ